MPSGSDFVPSCSWDAGTASSKTRPSREGLRVIHAALALAHLGRVAEARRRFEQACPQAIQSQPGSGIELNWLLETAVLLADHERAAALASESPRPGSIAYESVDATCVARHLGSASHLAGDRAGRGPTMSKPSTSAVAPACAPRLRSPGLALAELLLDGSSEEQAGALEHLDFAIEEIQAKTHRAGTWSARFRHKGLLHA